MLIAVCPGSFDPITLGHLDIIERSAYIYDRIIVGIADNQSKTTLFSLDERISMANEVLKDLKKVEVNTFTGLLVEFVRQNGAKAVIKGLRAISDFEHEFQMAHLNKKLDSAVETVFMMASPEYMFLSSSAVKEIAAFGGDVSEFVPPVVKAGLTGKFKKDL